MKKFYSALLIVGLCTSSAFLIKNNEAKTSKAWVALGYAASKRKNISAEKSAALGVIAACHSTMHGIIWGTAFGGPAGAVAGFTVSL